LSGLVHGKIGRLCNQYIVHNELLNRQKTDMFQTSKYIRKRFVDQVFLVLSITANVCYHFSGDISLCLR